MQMAYRRKSVLRIFLIMLTIQARIECSAATKTSTVQQDRTMLSKLLYDFEILREKVAVMYEESRTDTHEFARAETQLLRLESRLHNLRSTLWYKLNVYDPSNPVSNSSKHGRKNRRNLSLSFTREMLRYKLYTDGGTLTMDHRKRLSDKLEEVLFLIGCKRLALEKKLIHVSQSLPNVSTHVEPNATILADHMFTVQKLRLQISVLEDKIIL